MRPSFGQIAGHDYVHPQGGLRWWHIYLIFFGWTLFSVFLYTQFSTLGDSQAYLTGAYDEGDAVRSARTLAITMVAETVFALVRVELFAHLVFSAFAATGVVYMVKQARLRGRYHWPLLAILLTPNFGVWASAVGRESLYVGLMGFFMGAVLRYYRNPSVHQALLALICIGAMTFIRLPYGMGTALFFLMFLVYRSGPRTGLTAGTQALLFTMTCLLVLALSWSYLDSYISGDVLPKAASYFTIHSETTRTWIEIDTTVDLLTSLWWSLPLALVGPTPAEVLARPLMLPFFLSGLVVFGSLLYSIGVAINAPPGRIRKILLLGWLPAIILILIAYVPFGIYNPGSAIRYASCFLLFVIFPSMLVSSVAVQAPVKTAAPTREIASPLATNAGGIGIHPVHGETDGLR